MEVDFKEEERYLVVKKRVKKIKEFYNHLFWYILVNTFLSIVIISGKVYDQEESIWEVLTDFSVYSVWFFWGIGMFFHWMGVFGFGNFLSKKWEDKKIQELMEQEERKQRRISNL